MKSTLLSASVLALTALTAGSAFAEGRDIYSPENASFVSTKTRAQVQAELAQAQREGFNVNLGNNWNGDKAAAVGSKARAQVRQEVAASTSVSTGALERDYPVVR